MSDLPDTIEEAYESDLDTNAFAIGQIREIATRHSEDAEERIDEILEKLDELDEVRE